MQSTAGDTCGPLTNTERTLAYLPPPCEACAHCSAWGLSHRPSPGSDPEMLSFPPPLWRIWPTLPRKVNTGVVHGVGADLAIELLFI
jgi:hypothetical protein